MSRVVLDTNVVFAALAARGLCESVFEICLERHSIYISQFLIDELHEKLIKRLKLPTAFVEEFIELYASRSTIVEPTKLPKKLCRDTDDIAVIGTAVAADADYLITGDKDLLTLERHEQILIVTPRVFYESA